MAVSKNECLPIKSPVQVEKLSLHNFVLLFISNKHHQWQSDNVNYHNQGEVNDVLYHITMILLELTFHVRFLFPSHFSPFMIS